MPSFDSARLAELPADLRALFEAQRAMLEAERIRAENELVTRLHVESELAASKETVERLQLLVKEYERARFGKRSEKFDPDQLQLILEDIEIAIAEVQEREDDRARRSGRPATRKRAGRTARAFPAHLRRVERVIEPASLACPCGCGLMVRIGEDRSSRLDVTPAQYRVVETVRPRYACPKGCAGVAQAPAPAHLTEGGFRPRRCWRKWRSRSSASTCRSTANRRSSRATGSCSTAPFWPIGWGRRPSISRRSSIG